MSPESLRALPQRGITLGAGAAGPHRPFLGVSGLRWGYIAVMWARSIAMEISDGG